MKKFLKIAALLAGGFIAFGMAGCANDSSDPSNDASTNNNNPVVNPANPGSGESGSDSAVTKGSAYTEQKTIDLSETPLSATTVEKYPVGSEITDYFTQNTMTSGSSRAVVTSEEALKNFKAIVVEISETKLVVKFEAQTVNYDCSVYVSVNIPPEATKDNIAVVKLVNKVEIGEGVEDEDDDYFLKDEEYGAHFARSSGTGLYSTYKYESKSGSTILIFKNDNTFSGIGSGYYSESWTEGASSEITVKDEHISSGDISGVFANAGGILTLKGKNVWTSTRKTTRTEGSNEPVVTTENETIVYDYESELFIYDGNNLYVVHAEGKLPTVSN